MRGVNIADPRSALTTQTETLISLASCFSLSLLIYFLRPSPLRMAASLKALSSKPGE